MDAFRRFFKPDEYRDEQGEAKGRPGDAGRVLSCRSPSTPSSA